MDIADVLQHTSPELFIAELQASNKKAALAEMVEEALLKGSPVTNADTILSMLESREQLGSTAVGPGVAFPHGRTLAVQKLTVVIARSAAGIDFNSEDGNPTHLFFMLIAPPQDSGHQYIKSLAVLTERMQDAPLRDAILAAEDFDAFCEAIKGE